jgi:hypothetical protein
MSLTTVLPALYTTSLLVGTALTASHIKDNAEREVRQQNAARTGTSELRPTSVRPSLSTGQNPFAQASSAPSTSPYMSELSSPRVISYYA